MIAGGLFELRTATMYKSYEPELQISSASGWDKRDKFE
jgi:hypothetical protein